MRSRSRFRTAKHRRREGSPWGLKIFLIFLLCAAVLFTVAVVLGNYLKEISYPGDESDAGTTEVNENRKSRYNSQGVPVIIASCYDSINRGSDTVSSSAEQSSAVSYNAVSLRLRSKAEPDGTDSGAVNSGSITGMELLYTSAVSSASPYDSRTETELSALLASARERQSYVSGVFEVGFQNAGPSSRSILREYELSLLCELFSAGIDDVVLTGFSASQFEEAAVFMRDLKSRCTSEVCAGLALEFDFYEDSGFRDIINAADFDCGFLAVDLTETEVPGLMSAGDVVYDRVTRILSAVSLYSLRVLVGCGEAAGYESELSNALRAGALNIQIAGK